LPFSLSIGILAALLDGDEFRLELLDGLAALADGSLGGFLGLADLSLQVDGLGVLLEDLLFVEETDVGSGRVGVGGGEQEREEGLHVGMDARKRLAEGLAIKRPCRS
jgi:hypothetical protein